MRLYGRKKVKKRENKTERGEGIYGKKEPASKYIAAKRYVYAKVNDCGSTTRVK